LHGPLKKNKKNSEKKIKFGPPPPGPLGGVFRFFQFFLGKFQNLFLGSETLDMTSEGLGEMFEGDSADTCAGKFPLVSMGGQTEGLVCADPGVRTPIGASGIPFLLLLSLHTVVQNSRRGCLRVSNFCMGS
jgi:hypothetical protein